MCCAQHAASWAAGPLASWPAIFLPARASMLLVLEKHKDFLRDFRGDTIHPSTLEVMSELGLLDAFWRGRISQVEAIDGVIGARDSSGSPISAAVPRCKFVAFMPQWDFLDFLSDEGKRWPNFI